MKLQHGELLCCSNYEMKPVCPCHPLHQISKIGTRPRLSIENLRNHTAQSTTPPKAIHNNPKKKRWWPDAISRHQSTFKFLLRKGLPFSVSRLGVAPEDTESSGLAPSVA